MLVHRFLTKYHSCPHNSSLNSGLLLSSAALVLLAISLESSTLLTRLTGSSGPGVEYLFTRNFANNCSAHLICEQNTLTSRSLPIGVSRKHSLPLSLKHTRGVLLVFGLVRQCSPNHSILSIL
jgi:hypothetical protein